MPFSEARQVKRPRMALSCVQCRRRKVRCGKEQPQCRNCERLAAPCTYNTGTRDPSTGRVLRIDDGESQGIADTHLRSDAVQLVPSNQESTRGDGQNEAPEPEALDGRVLPADHLSVQRGARTRLIGKSFWGFVNGQENLIDDFFYDEPKTPADLPPPHIESTLVAKSLYALPTKAVSDILLSAFLTSVHSIHPVVDESSLQADYHEFWEWSRKEDLLPPAKLIQDPSFICLLFAVLLTGASAAPDSTWRTSTLEKLDRRETINQLRAAWSETLTACRYTEHPTLNTFTASLLVHHFTEKASLENALFVSTILRLAQSMGLHEDCDSEAADIENRRRVWWHIAWLDVQTSVSSGLPPCCGSDMLYKAEMVSTTKRATKHTPQDKTSVVMLYATGRYEFAKLQSQIVRRFQGTKTIPRQVITELAESTEQLHHSIDQLISIIPMQGFPEKGMFPSRFTNAPPQTLSSLYDDQAEEPSILGAWTRIMLSLLKLESKIMLQKSLLEAPGSSKAESSWNAIVRLCQDYLQMYLLLRTPMFEPYAWFCSRYHGPRQCVLLVLIYLSHYQQANTEDERAMTFCVDETLEFCALRQNPVSRSEETDSRLTLKVLMGLRRQLHEARQKSDSLHPVS